MELVERWDRTIGAIRPPATPNHDGEEQHSHPQSGKKGKRDKGDKHKHDAADKEPTKQEVSVNNIMCQCTFAKAGDICVPITGQNSQFILP